LRYDFPEAERTYNPQIGNHFNGITGIEISCHRSFGTKFDRVPKRVFCLEHTKVLEKSDSID